MKRVVTPLLIVATGLAIAQSGAPGLDRTWMDTSCKPCDDFWRYANGAWLDRNPIPAEFGRWGTFNTLQEANQERLKVILENAAANGSGDARRAGDFYMSCMDTTAVDAAGAKPMEPALKRVAAIASRGDLVKELAVLELEGGLGPTTVSEEVDLENSKQTIASIDAGGLSLPDRDYYLNEDERTKGIRTEFLKHVERTFVLLGDSAEAAAAQAKAVVDFETNFARARLTRVERRDPYKQFHKMDVAALTQLAPAYDWKGVLASLHVPAGVPVNVHEPEFVKAFQQALVATPVETWKTWLRWRIANDRSQYLSKAFYDEWFRFNQTVLTGVEKQQARWKVCVGATNAFLGEAMGKLFVEKHFPPRAKERMTELVENLRATLREDLEKAEWLEAATRKNALAKLEAFQAMIGYPVKWRDYGRVAVDRKDYVGSVESAALEARRFALAKIGKQVDRDQWEMTPPTVNAYYSPDKNQIVFPAGILQPPFFDLNADDAVNYGAIGAVIGHEMGHGFDDQGAKFDAQGNLKNWWTEKDIREFEARAACVVDQFNSIETGEGMPHNGKLVTGEAMGDLGGLTLAYKAYQRSLQGKKAPVIDGFTGEQRFFLSFAHVWAAQNRPEMARLRLQTDPHPLPKFRANATLQNMPEFRAAFGCKAGDPMVRPAGRECKVW